jgi:hypothetical protein
MQKFFHLHFRSNAMSKQNSYYEDDNDNDGLKVHHTFP